MSFCLVNAQNGVKYFKSDSIKTKHGFSTRHAGVSVASHLKSLNLGFGRGDTDETVKENYKIFCASVGTDFTSLVSAKQIHSNKVIRIGKNLQNLGGKSGNILGLEAYEADGFITDEENITLAVKVADCVPILLYDETSGIIGALHAGWRSTLARICENFLHVASEMGASAKNFKVAIGQSIGRCCFTVGDEYINTLESEFGKDFKNRFLFERGDGTYSSDLALINEEILVSCGVLRKNIDILGKCTCCDTDTFFSHRGQKGERGTMCAIISK